MERYIKKDGCHMKVIIYGLGKVFREIVLSNKKFFFDEAKYNILACCDKNSESTDNVITFSSEKMVTIIKPEEILNYEYDYIFVTSLKYFDEIKSELKVLGISENKIKSIYWPIWQAQLREVYFNKIVDIGGPTKLFHEIYNMADIVDIVNFSNVNTWNPNGIREKFANRGGELL